MTPGARSLCLSTFLVLHAFTSYWTPSGAVGPQKAQITILYDAFGQASQMQKDWGYAALIEFGGKRILFDTGNNPETLAHNAQVKGVDLSRLDFVVMSHRHGDHMGGLSFVLKINRELRFMRPRKGSVFMAVICRDPSTAETPHCRPNSATLMERRQRSCTSAQHGREQTLS